MRLDIYSFLALLKIGAAYLPLNLGASLIRLAVMVGDGQDQGCASACVAIKDPVFALGVKK